MTNETNATLIDPPKFYEPHMERFRATDLAYMRAVASAPFVDIAIELEGAEFCDECDTVPNDEGTRDEHGMIGPFVIIGCQGYHAIRSIADKMK
jgi:hypothetical protein